MTARSPSAATSATSPPSDDGTTDFVIWHAQPGGGVLLWAVGGGGDTEPRLWHDLRTALVVGGRLRPLVGDFTGDGWDDLMVRHRNGAFGTNIWVFPSDGRRLGAPEIWSTHEPWLDSQSYAVGDLVPDAYDDLLRAFPATNTIPYLLYTASTRGGRPRRGPRARHRVHRVEPGRVVVGGVAAAGRRRDR